MAGGMTVRSCECGTGIGENLLVPVQQHRPGTCSAFSTAVAEASGRCSAETDLTDSFALFGFFFFYFIFFMLGGGTLSRWQSIKNNKAQNLAAVIHRSPSLSPTGSL